jgi:hypothetical protein
MNINDNTLPQLTLSYELLLLLQWMIIHEKDKIKKIVHKALKSGLHIELEKIRNVSNTLHTAEELHENIADFFALLELFLQDGVTQSLDKRALNQKILSTIDQIDSTVCDSQTVEATVQCTSSILNQDPSANVKDLLYKELIKRWKPTDKVIH